MLVTRVSSLSFPAKSNYNPLGIIARVSRGVEIQKFRLIRAFGFIQKGLARWRGLYALYAAYAILLKKYDRYEGDHVIKVNKREYPVFGNNVMERSIC